MQNTVCWHVCLRAPYTVHLPRQTKRTPVGFEPELCVGCVACMATRRHRCCLSVQASCMCAWQGPALYLAERRASDLVGR